MSRQLTYGDFFRTGIQDCGNTLELQEFDFDSGGSTSEIVDRGTSDMDSADGRALWVGQQDDDFEGLDPGEAYESWKRGWRSCARRQVESEIQRRKGDMEMFYVATTDPEGKVVDIIERFDTLDEALNVLARIDTHAAVLDGDGNGPDQMIGWVGNSDLLLGPLRRNISLAQQFQKMRTAARARGFRSNPSPTREANDEEQAVDKFKEFHSLDPKELIYDGGFHMPRRVRCLGDADWITYRSMKVIPDNGVKPRKPVDYIHEHDGGVKLYVPNGTLTCDVPSFIIEAQSLTRLGDCLGYGFKKKDGSKGEAKAHAPLPELYCIPSGRALVVVQSKKEILAIVWGGSLAVESRGITG